MKYKVKKTIMNLAALSSMALGIFSSLVIFVSIVYFSISINEANMAKLFIIDFILFILALIIFLICLGLYEFFKSFTQIEDEIDKLENKVETNEIQTNTDTSDQTPKPINNGTTI